MQYKEWKALEQRAFELSGLSDRELWRRITTITDFVMIVRMMRGWGDFLGGIMSRRKEGSK